MGFGKTLREAREAKGYTVAQLAEITHITPGVIGGLEAEDFHDIVAPIYGRGFVKLCCQTLGIDPKPMVEEFMAIYNGEKPPTAGLVSAEAKLPEPPPSVPEPPPAEPVPAEAPIADEPPPKAPLSDLFNQVPEQPAASEQQPAKQTVSRFAPPQPQDDDRSEPFTMPAIPWRLVILIAGAAVVLWALFAGIRAVYRALGTGGDGAKTPAPVVKVERLTDGAAAPSVRRTPKPVKPLYID